PILRRTENKVTRFFQKNAYSTIKIVARAIEDWPPSRDRPERSLPAGAALRKLRVHAAKRGAGDVDRPVYDRRARRHGDRARRVFRQSAALARIGGLALPRSQSCRGAADPGV